MKEDLRRLHAQKLNLQDNEKALLNTCDLARRSTFLQFCDYFTLYFKNLSESRKIKKIIWKRKENFSLVFCDFMIFLNLHVIVFLLSKFSTKVIHL